MPDGTLKPEDRVDRFHDDPSLSHTLKARYYFDAAIARAEQDAIFFTAWNYVAHVSQLADIGAYVTTQIGDQNIAVVRGRDGALNAFYNVCSHRAHELLSGAGRTNLIVCPYHAWAFALDGTLVKARNTDGMVGFDKADHCLKAVRVEVMAGFVFVCLDPATPSLAQSAAGLPQEIAQYCPDAAGMKFAARLTYDLKANWKNIVDNYLECYHCQPAHPAFVDLIDLTRYRSVVHGIYSSHIGPAGNSDNTAYAVASGPGQVENFAGWWLWPNVTIQAVPGGANITVLHIMPTGPETVREHFDFFTPDGTLGEADRAAIDYLDKVLQPEDIGLVESVQRGLHSHAYDQGRLVVDAGRTELSEHAIHHFHSLVRRALHPIKP